MKVLLTNDDGIDAPGLAALQEAAQSIRTLVTVAPLHGHSGCGHRVTTDGALNVTRRGAAMFAVDGTPADCVRLALHTLSPEVDCVLAGINAGGNLGADIWHSGTVAAVREAVLHGKTGIAFSQYRKRDQAFDWARSVTMARTVLAELLHRPPGIGAFWNVNLPHITDSQEVPQIVFCPVNPHPLPLSYLQSGDSHRYNGNYHNRRRDPGSDVDVCFSGNIAVSQIVLR